MKRTQIGDNRGGSGGWWMAEVGRLQKWKTGKQLDQGLGRLKKGSPFRSKSLFTEAERWSWSSALLNLQLEWLHRLWTVVGLLNKQSQDSNASLASLPVSLPLTTRHRNDIAGRHIACWETHRNSPLSCTQWCSINFWNSCSKAQTISAFSRCSSCSCSLPQLGSWCSSGDVYPKAPEVAWAAAIQAWQISTWHRRLETNAARMLLGHSLIQGLTYLWENCQEMTTEWRKHNVHQCLKWTPYVYSFLHPWKATGFQKITKTWQRMTESSNYSNDLTK